MDEDRLSAEYLLLKRKAFKHIDNNLRDRIYRLAGTARHGTLVNQSNFEKYARAYAEQLKELVNVHIETELEQILTELRHNKVDYEAIVYAEL